jgi:catechol-2,3-dioxygenase
LGDKRVIRGLGEIALQVHDLEEMTRFYERVVNLELMRESGSVTFFRVAEGVEGHTQILALFDRSDAEGYGTFRPGRRNPPLDHLAFAISRNDFEEEHQRLVDLGCDVSLSIHAWVGWRSMYVEDPEGNEVEWVCYEEELLDDDA